MTTASSLVTLYLSEAAEAHIQSILKKYPGSVGFLLSIKKTGCSGYSYLPQILHKQTSEHLAIHPPGRQIILFVENTWKELLNAVSIDLEIGSLGQRKLIYHNPNVKNPCGCGESFTPIATTIEEEQS